MLLTTEKEKLYPRRYGIVKIKGSLKKLNLK